MKNKILILTLVFVTLVSAQDKKNSRWNFTMSYGPQLNFFVKYDRTKEVKDGYFTPTTSPVGYELYQKRTLGNHLGFALNYRLSKKGSLGLSFERAENFGTYKVNFLVNGTLVRIRDIKLRHLNNYFELNYKRNVKNNNQFFWQFGIYLLDPHQQEISTEFDRIVSIKERTGFGQSHLNEMGLRLGFDYYFYTSGKFDIGVTNNYYFTATMGEFESINFNAILKYNF